MHSSTPINASGTSGGECLRVDRLSIAYPEIGGGRTVVLDRLSFSMCARETVAIVGPNGCGKSTLLLAIAGLLQTDSGQIYINGKIPRNASIGLVFQNYRESLLPWRTVEDNAAFALEMRGIGKSERKRMVAKFVEESNLELPLQHYPYQMSGGQQQTVSILRALIAQPDLLLLDEPFGSLDYRARLNMHQRIQEILEHTKQTVVLVSHEIDEAILLSDRVLVMSQRPAAVLADIPVKFPKPRPREIVLENEFLRIKREVFAHFPV